MRYLEGCALAAVLLAGAGVATAACSSTAECLKIIEAAQQDTQSVSARFTQTKHLSLLDEPLISTGTFIFKRPDRMRLQIDTPRPALILIKGREISIPGISDSDRQQLSMTPMAAMFTELGAMFGGSAEALSKHFTVSAVSTDDGIEVTLDPKVPDWQRLFRRIQLRFSGPQLVMHTMRLDDALGDTLEIVMSDVQRNTDLPDSMFEAAAPPAQ